jgi:ABC-type dipeptide/oligopeptide/nickel transport system permease component
MSSETAQGGKSRADRVVVNRHPMLRYVVSRLAQAFILVMSITLLVFVILRLTSGDPAEIANPLFARQDVIEQYREKFGTDRSMPEQLWSFLSDAARGDLGDSFRYQESVTDLILTHLPYTLALAALALLLSVTTAIVLGVLAARYPRSPVAGFASGLAIIGQSAPAFWVGLMLISILSLRLGWLPASGFEGPSSWILPAIAIALATVPTELRVLRASMMDVLQQEHVEAARAAGLRETRIVYLYALRNAVLPLLTVIGIDMGYMLGGVIVVESVFDYPGIGQLALTALESRDYPLIQGITIVTAGIFVVTNLIVDLLYVVIDPRIRLEGAR